MVQRLAVIGGGSVATSFLFHLARARQALSSPGPLEVRIFEPRGQLGRGDAYAEDLDTNLLNVTAGSMSIAEDDRAHFMRWLQRQGTTHFRGQAITPATFLPRPLFGAYLEDTAREACAAACAAGIRLHHVQQPVVDLYDDGRGLHLQAGDGAGYGADHAVLAMGNLPATSFGHLRGTPGYHASPYPVGQLVAAMPRTARVCVLGTSLSAIDAVAALAAAGHTGPVHCVSRNGRLPSVRGLHNPPVQLTDAFRATLAGLRARGARLALAELATLLAQELAAHGVPAAEGLRLGEPAGDALAYLDAEVDAATTGPRPWQAVSNAFNEVIDQAWQVLGEAGRHDFDRMLRSVWMARRVTFPLENALTLRGLLRTGQLRIEGGFIAAQHDPAAGCHRIRFARPASGSGPATEQVFEADHVVNATSFSSDATRATSPLLQALLASGLAAADPQGGLRVDFGSGCLVAADGTVDHRVSVLGTLATGTYFWTNSMDVNARLARHAASRLVRGAGDGGKARGRTIVATGTCDLGVET